MTAGDSISRRAVVKGLAGLPLAAVLADPLLVRAVAASLETVTLTRADGKVIRAALALPERTPAGSVLLIHEWWGLDDEMKTITAELAREGYVGLAVDLFDGSVATTPDEARVQTQAVDAGDATETLVAWIEWLREHEHGNGRVAVVGWCFGGAWSLNASLATPVDATVIYYGRVDKTADEVEALEGPVLGHFGTLDQSIDPEMVAGFERALEAADKPHTIHMYEADHAFASPTGGRYDADDAALAWRRTLAFLEANLHAG